MPISPTSQTSSTLSTTSFQYVVKYSCEEGHTVTGLVDGSGAFERLYECGADLQPEGWVRGQVLPLTHRHLAHLIVDIVEWRSAQSHHERHDRRILLKERSTPYHYSKQKGDISEDVSDHSLSSC